MIRIGHGVAIEEAAFEEQFIRASGPGGQNVNKVASAVQLRLALDAIQGLSEEARRRLATLAGRRLTQEGVLVIAAQRFRTQERNRADAMERMIALVREALVRPRPRVATRPTLASKTRRLDAKRERAAHKVMRRKPPGDD